MPNSPRPQCIITGCALYIPAEGKVLWGDLHEFRDLYIFNGVVRNDGSVAWTYVSPDPDTHWDKMVVVNHLTAPYFDKRGIVVLAKEHCELNPAAKAYLGEHYAQTPSC
jgi:hypothetical protein